MDERTSKIATLANVVAYDDKATKIYVDGAPHIKHASIRGLYAELVVEIFDYAKKYTKVPRVLDLGAGEGSVTLPFLELGAKVVAVDISKSQLDVLRSKCASFEDMLEIRCEDINNILQSEGEKYDIIVVNSFLHHIPDYLELIRNAVPHIDSHGQFFSFQDPMRYDSISRLELFFTNWAYFSWRVFKGDVLCGFMRYLRRRKGVYLDDSVHDNAEYHVTRNGVDQTAIKGLMELNGFDCRVVSYFSTQSSFYQFLGAKLGVKNNFAIVAKKIPGYPDDNLL